MVSTLSRHIAARGRSGVCQLRLAVPVHLRGLLGKREFTQSLQTSDRREAERRALPILADWHARLDAAEAQARNIDIRGIAHEVGFERMTIHLEESRRSVDSGAGAMREFVDKQRGQYLELVRKKRDGQLGVFEEIANILIKKRSLPIAKGSGDHRELIEGLSNGAVEAMSLDLRRNEGDFEAQPTSASTRARVDGSGRGGQAGQSLVDLFEMYARQRLIETTKRPTSIVKDRKMITSLAEFAGVRRPASSLTKADVRDWINARAAMPPNYEKMARYRNMTLTKAAEVAARAGLPPVSPQTLNSYLPAASALFKWLIARDHHPGPNPCDGIFFDAPKGKNPRRPFSTDQLNAILASPLFVGFLGDGMEHEIGNCRVRDWRFWIPLVCLFTGARVSEIAQLLIRDVVQDGDGWLIHIRHDEEVEQNTKSGQSRIVPIHSELVEIGFVRFCEQRSQLADPVTPLFEGAGGGTRAGDRASRFWRDYLQAIGVKEAKAGGDGLGVHSFRHTLADRLREEGKQFDWQVALALGHTFQSVTSGYGQVKQGTVEMLREMFAKVRFDGVKLAHLRVGTVNYAADQTEVA